MMNNPNNPDEAVMEREKELIMEKDDIPTTAIKTLQEVRVGHNDSDAALYEAIQTVLAALAASEEKVKRLSEKIEAALNVRLTNGSREDLLEAFNLKNKLLSEGG